MPCTLSPCAYHPAPATSSNSPSATPSSSPPSGPPTLPSASSTGLAFAWIAITAILRRKEVATHGLGLRGLLPSLWIVAAAILIALAGIALANHLHTLHPLYGPLPVLTHLWGYALWALMQQFILQIYVLTRFLRLGLRRNPAVALATLLFAAAHIPNPLLVALTLIWGALSCALFLRYRNLYTLALAHGILGMYPCGHGPQRHRPPHARRPWLSPLPPGPP